MGRGPFAPYTKMRVGGILWGRRQNLPPFKRFLIANGITRPLRGTYARYSQEGTKTNLCVLVRITASALLRASFGFSSVRPISVRRIDRA